MNKKFANLSFLALSILAGPIFGPSFSHSAFADGIQVSADRADAGSAVSAAEGSSKAGGSNESGGSGGVSENSVTKFEKASPAAQSIAIGHFARTRSLLVAALNEFEAGVRKADPSSLIDTARFSETIKARARELDRVLDPQARESESGVKYSADERLLERR